MFRSGTLRSAGITVLLILFIYPIVFLKLDGYSLRLWDESMFALNTYEMLLSGNWMVPVYEQAPDLWNSKPPLFLWAQMCTVNLFGYTELALRLPSAIATTVILIAMFWYAERRKGLRFACIAFLLLLTSYGFVTYHSARTGDADALLGLFLFCGNILFIDIIYTGRITANRIYLFFLMIGLAFWTKSIQAFLFIPGYLLTLYYYKNIGRALIKNRHFWMGLTGLMLMIVLFLALREQAQPGYLELFFGNDAGRFISKVDEHKEPFIYYFETLLLSRYSFWMILYLIGLAMIISNGIHSGKTDRFLFPVSLLSITYFLIISCSVTKVPWYDVPLYPLMALVAAGAINQALSLVEHKKSLAVVLILIFIFPYIILYGRSNSNAYSSYEEVNEAKERYLFRMMREKKDPSDLKVFQPGYDRSVKFYKIRFAERGQSITISKHATFAAGDQVLFSAFDDTAAVRIKQAFKYSLQDSTQFIQLITLDEKK